MRPLSLAIEGFTAFRDRQEIDFEPLDLFVITGPTGAGKTSILDAMVFALYGQVPRLGGRQGTSDLVSLGTVEARILFEFSIDGKGRYRVARRLRRGAAQAATLERFDVDRWVSACERGGVRECDRVLNELLGLDFDSFCKAVVLPQGEFHRFLKGDPAERRRVLVSLLGVSYFQRMGELARTRRTHLAAGVERTQEILIEQYGDATLERVQELRTASGEAAERSAALTASVSTAEERSSEAAKHDEHAKGLRARVSDFEALAVGLRNKVDACRAAEAAKSEAARGVSQAAADLGVCRVTTTDAEAALSALQSDFGTVDRIAEAAAAAETLRAAATEERSAQAKLDAAQEAQAAANRELKEAEQEETDTEPELQAALAAEKESAATLDEAAQASQKLEQLLREARRCNLELEEARERLNTARTVVDGSRAGAQRLRDALDEAVAHLEEHRRANAVAELAHGLGPGDPCPVCGGALSSPVAVAADVADVLAAGHDQEHTARTAADEAATEVARAEANVDAAEEHQRVCEQRLNETLEGRENVNTLETELEAAAATGKAAVEQVADSRTAREAVQGKRDNAHDRLLKARGEASRCEALTDAARNALADVQERQSRAAKILTEHFGGETPNDAAEQIAEQRTHLLAAMEATRVARSELDRATEKHEAARTEAEVAERQLADLDVDLARLRTRAETGADATSELLTVETTLVDLPHPGSARDAAASELAGWCDVAAQAASAAGETAEQARDATQQHVLAIAAENDIEAPSGERALALLRTAERTARDDATKAQSASEEAARRADQRRVMEERIKDESEQIATLGDLALELQGDRFGEYIILETLDLLAAHASEELLRISDGRYSLAPVEGDFHVVDHANADEQRSVKTLSGGETFLASLALALALSRHVGDLATEGLGAKLEAVFIDEGFGTLDPSTLDEVIDALERLHAADLVVGVISHVPELAQRIRSGLEVQTEGGRSKIVASVGA